MKIGIFVINYNGARNLGKKFEIILNNLSKLKQLYNNIIDIWIVDNSSNDSSINIITRYKNLNLIRLNRNLGYGNACNIAYLITKRRRYKYDILMFINNDIIIDIEKFNILIKIIDIYNKQFKEFIATVILINGYNNSIDYGGFFIDSIGNTWSLNEVIQNPNIIEKIFSIKKNINIHYADGAFLILPTSTFEKVGGFNKHFFMYVEDVELSFKAHSLHIPVLLIPLIAGIHYRSATSKPVSLFTIYNVVRNTIYVILTYFGLINLIKLIFFYIFFSFNIIFDKKNYRRMHQRSGLYSNLANFVKAAATGLIGFIDGVRVWAAYPRRYYVPKDRCFNVAILDIVSFRKYKLVIQKKILSHIIKQIKV